MTNQELYTTVRRHLLTQNARSLGGKHVMLHSCAYRGANGLKCAIGCLIPDDRYKPELEGLSVSTPQVASAAQLVDVRKWLFDGGAVDDQIDLAQALQSIHDSNDVEDWQRRLDEIAEVYGFPIE